MYFYETCLLLIWNRNTLWRDFLHCIFKNVTHILHVNNLMSMSDKTQVINIKINNVMCIKNFMRPSKFLSQIDFQLNVNIT